MKKIASVLFLFSLLFAHSDFLRANFQDDCFDRKEIITVGKYLDFLKAVALNDEAIRQSDADLMPEANQAERDAPMLGLSQEEAMRYCDWVKNGDDKYHLNANDDGSFALVENGTSSPLMMFGWGRRVADPTFSQRLVDQREEAVEMQRRGADGADDHQARGDFNLGEQMPREDQENNQSAGQPRVKVDDFIRAALDHGNASRLVVRGLGEDGVKPVFAMQEQDDDWLGSRAKETRIQFKEALRREYGNALDGKALVSGLLYSRWTILRWRPVSSIKVFKTIMIMEQRATTDALNAADLSREKWNEYVSRQEKFKNSAVEFASKISNMPAENFSKQRVHEIFTRAAAQVQGQTTLLGPYGVGVTLDNHDVFMLAASILEPSLAEDKRRAVAIALHACYSYEEKLLRKARAALKTSRAAVEANRAVKRYGWEEEESEEAVRDDNVMSASIEVATSELKALWEESKKRYDKFTDCFYNNINWYNGKFWRTHYLEEINQSVPWCSHSYGSWNPGFGRREFHYLSLMYQEIYQVNANVRNVIRRTYSLRHNLHEVIMHRGLFSWDRKRYVDKAFRHLQIIKENIQKYKETYNGENENTKKWKEFLKAAETAAEEAYGLITYIDECKNKWYVF